MLHQACHSDGLVVTGSLPPTNGGDMVYGCVCVTWCVGGTSPFLWVPSPHTAVPPPSPPARPPPLPPHTFQLVCIPPQCHDTFPKLNSPHACFPCPAITPRTHCPTPTPTPTLTAFDICGLYYLTADTFFNHSVADYHNARHGGLPAACFCPTTYLSFIAAPPPCSYAYYAPFRHRLTAGYIAPRDAYPPSFRYCGRFLLHCRWTFSLPSRYHATATCRGAPAGRTTSPRVLYAALPYARLRGLAQTRQLRALPTYPILVVGSTLFCCLLSHR